MNKTVTIKDIARISGFSVATVSNVINKTGKFYSVETEKKINSAIKELNYIPHALARELKKQKSKTIAYFVPYIDSFYDEIFAGLQNHAISCGFSVALYSANYDKFQDDVLINNLLEQRYAGLVLVQGLMEENKIKEVDNKTPLVVIGRLSNDDSITSISIDNYIASKDITKYLISLGHQKIAFISGPTSIAIEKDRFAGYIDAFQEAGLTIESSLIFEDKNIVTNNLDNCYKMIHKIITNNQNITAIFITSDTIAYVAMKVISDLGLNVAQDISVCGFDDLPISKYMIPPLTTVNQYARNIGVESIKILLNKINGVSCETYSGKSDIIIRDSTGPVNSKRSVK